MSNRPLRPLAVAVAVLLVPLLTLSGCSTTKSSTGTGPNLLAQGVAAQQAGDLATASKDYNAVLQSDPKNTSALYDLGLIAQGQGNRAEAASDYGKALAIDPNLGSALYNLAIVRVALGDRGGAEGLYRKAIAADPNNPDPYFNLGVLLRDSGRTAEGDAEIAKADALDPALRGRSPGGALGPGKSKSGKSK